MTAGEEGLAGARVSSRGAGGFDGLAQGNQIGPPLGVRALDGWGISPVVNSPKTPPKPRVSIAAEVDDLLTQAMADASSCKPEHSFIGKVTTVEAVTFLPQKSEASLRPVDTSF